MRAITCFSCPLAGRGSGPAGQTWATGGCGDLCLSASCGLVQRRASLLFWRGVHCRSPVCFFQELAKFVMSLSGSSSLGASGVLAGVTASAAASWGLACPASAAAGAATLCAATVTPAGAGVFCLLLPLLFLACPVISSVRESPALAGVAVGRLVMGPTGVLGAIQGKVSFFCPLFASSGGGAVVSSTASSVDDCSVASPSRSRHALGGAHTGSSSWDFVRSPRSGASRSSARVELMPVWSASSSASTFGCGGCCRLLYLRGVSPGVRGLGRLFSRL